MTSLTDQIAVITGASSGIGKAIVLALAELRATVCLIGRNSEALNAAADSARTTSPRVVCYQADLTLDEDVRQLVAHIIQDFGSIDMLIHAAGFISLGYIETASLEDFDRHYSTNVRAPYVLTQAFLPVLRKRRGQVVFINSSAGLNARANVGQYAATKHALKAFADSLREEVNAHGVRVLSVYPGRTATPMQEAIHQAEGKCYHPDRLMQPEDVASAVVNALNLPRTAELTDLYIRPFMKPD